GHCIRKMDQAGNVLLTLGEPGVKGFDDHHYNHPTDIGWDKSGNLYMTDGDNSEAISWNRRVLKYDKNGTFIKKWGSIGQGIGQFDYPHSILVDSKETVFVCDRNNWRVQVFDKYGNQEANWTHIGRVYKMVEDKNGDYFVSDGRVGRITKFDRDGTVIGFFETPDKGPGERGSLNNAHSLAICSNGDLITGTYQGWVERWKAPKDGHGKWTMLSYKGEPDGRHETTFVEFQDKFYLIGGRESRKIDRFDPKTKSWIKMKATSPLIHHFQPVLWDNKIYMVGAMTGNYPKEPPMSRIQIYDPLRDIWTQGGEIPKARQRGSAGTVLYKGKIYMVGGITLGHTSGTNNWFDEYNPATETWKVLPDAPHKRDHFHAVVVNDKLYCIGGRNTSYHEPDNFTAFFGAVIRAIDCYDFKSRKWTTLDCKLPVGSAAGGVAYLNGKILYFGGETAEKGPALNKTWAFDPKTETWKELANLNQGRHGSQAIVYDNRVYIAAGSPKRGGGRTNTIEMFSF
ncbi:MAG: Kelch repeat-containing protein, partial [Planctomycetota bacterium]